MLIALFIIVPFLVISHVHASHASSPSPSSSDLLSIFRAYTTGVLRVRQDSIDDGWLYHYMLPSTKVAVDRIGQLLLKDSVHHHNPSLPHAEKTVSPQDFLASALAQALRYRFGCGAVKTPRNVLVTALKRRGTGPENNWEMILLIRYAVFKALMYQGISQEEAGLLVSISSEMPLDLGHLFKIGELVNDLTRPKSHADLFRALRYSIDIDGVYGAVSILADWWPEITIKLVEEYIACNDKHSMHIPSRLLSCLPPKSQYDLLRTKIVPWQSNLAHSHSLYILSRFSESPSERIQRLCLKYSPKYQAYEQVAQKVKGHLLTSMKSLNPEMVPKEIWVMILLYCDNFLFHIYTVPLVCKFWQGLHHILLSHSSTVQEAFMNDRKDTLTTRQIFNHRRYPWNYFLNSSLAFFTYSVVCLESLWAGITNQEIFEWVEAQWPQVVQQINRSGCSMTPSYFSLYVRSCKVLGRSLEFYQLPSISDETYIALIRDTIAPHKIVPLLPKRFFGEDCRKFVQMLERDGSLIILLPENDLQCCNRLAICLFLSKYCMPPKVDKILCRASKLHRLLKNVSLGAILQNPADGSGAGRLACGPDLETLRKSIHEHCFDQSHGGDTKGPELVLSTKRELSMAVMMLLCRNCQDYSEDEFCSILRVLELCGIFDQDSKSYVYGQHVSMLLNDPKFAIELIC